MARPTVAKTPFGERLTSVRMKLGYKDRKAFAAVLAMNPETLGGYERGDTIPDHSFLTRYKHDFSVNLDWLITGEGTMFRKPVGIHHRSLSGIITGADVADALPNMIRLPVYGEVQAAAGLSSIPASELAEGIMSFDRRFLRDQGAAPEHCSVIWAKGDSMTPTIPDGSALVVDRSQTAISNGCIMVIGVGDDLLVKRVRRRLDGLVELLSDNASYPPETLGPDSLQQLRVVGRVVYFCRTP